MNADLVLGGRPLPRALDDIRRYCGLDWSEGPPEVFAFAYFDALGERREDDQVRPVDVLSACVLHPGLRKDDLAYFVERSAELREELEALPAGTDLADSPERVVTQVASLAERLRPSCGLSLLSKVLHTKRPRLVPILDRAVTERYRYMLAGRGAAAWPTFVQLFRDDLAESGNRAVLAAIQSDVRAGLGERVPSMLRIADIAIWMAARER